MAGILPAHVALGECGVTTNLAFAASASSKPYHTVRKGKRKMNQIWINELGTLSLAPDEGARLATKNEFILADRCVGSIFEALAPGEPVQLAEGHFLLNSELYPVET